MVRLVLFALSVALCFTVSGAQDVVTAPGSKAEAAKSPTERRQPTQSARERWESLGPKERAEMRERFARLKDMPAPEREQLERRAKRLDSMARRIYQNLDEATRSRFDSLDPDRRRTLLHEMVTEEARVDAERLLDTLPTDLRQRVQSASSADRERFLRDFRHKHTDRVNRGLAKLGSELGVDESVRAAWEELPEEGRRAKLLELVQRKILREAQRKGLPDGLEPSDWKRVSKLPPPAFMDAFRRLREVHPELVSLMGRGHRGAGRPGSHGGGPPDGKANGERRGSHSDAGKQPGAGKPAMGRLMRALRPTHELRLEFAQLPASQRRAALNQRRREAVEKVLAEESLLQPDDLLRIQALEDGPYLEEVRRLATGRSGRGERHGKRPERRRRGGDKGDAPKR